MKTIIQLTAQVSIVETSEGICLNTGSSQPLSKPFSSVDAAKQFWRQMRDVDFYPSWEERAMLAML